MQPCHTTSDAHHNTSSAIAVPDSTCTGSCTCTSTCSRWLPGDAIEIEAEQGGVQAQPGGGDRRFTTGMAAADHDHVEGFGGAGVEAHGFIIRFWRSVGIASEVEVLQGLDGLVGVAPAAGGVVEALVGEEVLINGCE